MPLSLAHEIGYNLADERAHKLEELAGLVLEMARPELAPLIVVELGGNAHSVEVGRVRVAAEVELGVLSDIVQPKLALHRVCRRLGRVPHLLARRLLTQRAMTRPVQHQVQIVIERAPAAPLLNGCMHLPSPSASRQPSAHQN